MAQSPVARLCPLNGGSIVGTINDVQSIRQGCPLSVHLFAMFIEPLLVRLAENLKGIDLFGQKVALRAFVDDLTVFASSDHDITRPIMDSGSRIPNCSINPCSLTRCIKCSPDPRVRRGRRSDTGWLYRYVSRPLAGTMAPHSPMKTFRFTRKTPSQTRSLSAL